MSDANGRKWSRFAWARWAIPDAAATTTVCLSKQCSGLPAQAVLARLPAYRHWNSTFSGFRDWVKADVFKRLFDAVSDDPDMEYAMVDATIASPPPRTGRKRGLRASHRPVKRRHDDQILALTDALGNLVRFVLLRDSGSIRSASPAARRMSSTP